MSVTAYIGEHVTTCGLVAYDFHRNVNVVVVTGAWWNFCGHMILNVGEYYFHVDQFLGTPFRMNEEGYQRFLREAGKREVRRTKVRLWDPAAAFLKLEEILSHPWMWLGLPHNCSTFVGNVLESGGSSDDLVTNCPIGEPWGGPRFR